MCETCRPGGLESVRRTDVLMRTSARQGLILLIFANMKSDFYDQELSCKFFIQQYSECIQILYT